MVKAGPGSVGGAQSQRESARIHSDWIFTSLFPARDWLSCLLPPGVSRNPRTCLQDSARWFWDLGGSHWCIWGADPGVDLRR